MMEVVDCSAFNKIGTITSQITGGDKALALQYDGKLNIKDISLEGRLYQYGDISRCKSTIGAQLNNKTFQADSGKNFPYWFFNQKKVHKVLFCSKSRAARQKPRQLIIKHL